MRTLGDADDATPDGARIVEQHALEGEVRDGVGGVVLLRGVEVEMALAIDDVDGAEAPGRALTCQARLHAGLTRLGADRAGRPLERGVLRDLGAMRSEVQRGIVAVLDDDVREVRRFGQHELGDAVGVAGLTGQMLLDQRCLGTFAERHDHAPLLSGLRRGDLVRRVERQLDLDASRHVQEQAVGPERPVLGGEPLVVADDRAQNWLDQRGVLVGEPGEAAEHDTLRCDVGEQLLGDDATVTHDQTTSVVALTENRAGHVTGGRLGRDGVAIEVDAAQRREAPVLVAERRDPQRLTGLGCGLAPRLEPGAHPTEPSICSWIRRLSSTAYSSGSSFVIGSTKPATISAEASASDRPRLIR